MFYLYQCNLPVFYYNLYLFCKKADFWRFESCNFVLIKLLRFPAKKENDISGIKIFFNKQGQIGIFFLLGQSTF